MAELGHAFDVGSGWGPRERAAIDRALAIPTSSPKSGTGKVGPELRLRRLARTIETEIIPRLMLAHRGEEAVGTHDRSRDAVNPEEATTLAGLAISAWPDAARDHVAALRERGLGTDAVLLDVMAPAARLLGDMWREDLCTFTDVTIGLSRLQSILRSVDPEVEPAVPAPGCGRMLLVPAPGEQHTFGIAVLDNLIGREGWIVENGSGLSVAEIRRTVREQRFDILGISLSCDVLLPGLGDFIWSLRKASLNPAVHVMVGGRFFKDNPDRGAELGADAVVLDAQDALRQVRVGRLARSARA